MRDFESRASASSATPASVGLLRVYPTAPPGVAARSAPRSLALPLVALHVVDRELLQLGAVHAQVGGFLRRPVHVPVVHHHALEEPHGGGSPAARAMNECRLAAFLGNGFHKLVR